MNPSHPLDPSCRLLLARYDPGVKLSAIPWQELPACLQKTCEHFLKCWWDDIDIDQTIEASGLSDMTLSELLAYHKKQHQPRSSGDERKYRLVSFMRVESEDEEPMHYEEALAEKEQQELLCPEHIYRIEAVEPALSAH